MGEVVDRLSGERAAIDKNPAAVAGECNAVATGIGDVQHYTARISNGGTKVDRHVVAIFYIRHFRGGLDLDRVLSDRPLGDVDVVSAPIGNLTTRILVPPAKRVVAALVNEGHARRLAL